MKKMKILAPIMASVALVSPMMVSLTSCGKVDYTEKISELKDKAISIFMDLTKTTHRSVWVEGECFNFIKNKMVDLGFETPSGLDNWSKVPEVAAKIDAEYKKWEEAQIPQEQRDKVFSSYGNIWYDIPATKGMEDAPKIILHAHMDVSMAFESVEDQINWAKLKKNIINVQYDRDNELLKTDGKASLGADDGLGIAAMLAFAELHTKIKHGGIRLLFTAGESEGTTNYASGAHFLIQDQLHEGRAWVGKKAEGRLSEQVYLEKGSSLPFGEKGEYQFIISTSGIYKNYIYSSCGGIHQCQFNDQELTFNTPWSEATKYDANEVKWGLNKETNGELKLYSLKINGLHGGQSAKYINSGYANALQMLMRILFTSDEEVRLFSAYSNPGPYAIASSAEAVFATQLEEKDLKAKIELIIRTYANAYPNEDWKKFTWELTNIPNPEEKYHYSLSPNQTRAVTKLFAWSLIFGATDWFDKEHTSVRTSCNFGKLELNVDLDGGAKKSKMSVYNVCRSADEESLALFYSYSHTLLVDALSHLYPDNSKTEAASHTEHNEKPVWEKMENNKMVNALIDGYKNMGINATMWDNHGWLEISCFTEVYTEQEGWSLPYMSCVGPEVRNSHEVDEEVWTDTLNPCLGSLLYTFEHIKNYK